MPFRSREAVLKAVGKAVRRGVRDWGESVFDRSQRYVPVESSFLQHSGDFAIMDNGIQIIYRAPYAAERENIVPKKTRQRAPRGTHYLERAASEESLFDHLVNSLRRALK
jgi:hypothetical protein